MIILYAILPVICLFLCVLAKVLITWLICKHPKLSDEKVKYITKMFSKNSEDLSNLFIR